MSSEEGANDACPIHNGFLEALLHLQYTCNSVLPTYLPSVPQQQLQPLPQPRCKCSLHRILIKVCSKWNNYAGN